MNLSFNALHWQSLENLTLLKKSLEALDLSGNDLRCLPRAFAELRLKTLDLSNNQLSNKRKQTESCLTTLAEMPSLKNLYL